jgi:diacylglycerol kinase (ATP)
MIRGPYSVLPAPRDVEFHSLHTAARSVFRPPGDTRRFSGRHPGRLNRRRIRGAAMPSTEPRGPRQIYKALIWSLKGLRAGWTFEASFRLEVYLSIILIPLGLWSGRGAMEKALLAGSVLLVLSAELLNSAVEAVVDKVSPEFHELAGRAKDMGSAAVFLLMLNVLLCWGLVLWSRL